MSQVALQVRVTGVVQGVFFRGWAAEQALTLGVRGWIRNSADGSVEGHLEGDQAAVRALVDVLHHGPPSARVSHVDVDVVEPEGADGFEIRH